ncbi:hypothetical protein B6I21_03385 [candidate division KSB1 bacterium 4572_119]|nr:MAG: hypothetical protein B6I21_03385 [candidate division KSB1 bacterium 4572_119]
MAKTSKSEVQLLHKRKFYARSLVIFTVLMLLAFNLSSWLFFNQLDDYLERELEKRLNSIAVLTASKIESDFLEDLTSGEGGRVSILLLKSELTDLIYYHELQSAFIIDPNNVILIDGQNKFPEGQILTYLDQDSSAIEQAWSGTTTSSPIHFLEGNKFKTIFVPLKNDFYEVSALLVLEASADFFELLERFKQGLIVGGVVSLGLIFIFTFFISWMITLLIRTHDSMQQSAKLAAMGRMAASMAHEIRNPLGIIKGTSDVLKEKYAAESESEELFDYISAEVQRLNLLINNFLSFSREPKLNLKSSNLLQVIEKAVAAIEREDHEKKITIKIISTAALEPFNFDENAIQQVLFNLLINAQQAFESKGEIIIQIGRKTVKGKKYGRVSIADNGPGIDGDISQIFEPFYSTKSKGSGLGLAICKQIIEKHGGWIDAESAPQKGTTFNFYLLIK